MTVSGDVPTGLAAYGNVGSGGCAFMVNVAVTTAVSVALVTRPDGGSSRMSHAITSAGIVKTDTDGASRWPPRREKGARHGEVINSTEVLV